MAENSFLLEIITPERLFFKEEIEGMIVPGVDGLFGVLKGHIPMVASLEIGVLRIKANGQWREAACSEGFLRISPRHTLIMIQSAEWPEEIDIDRSLRQKREAEDKLRQPTGPREDIDHKKALARALTRLKVAGHNPAAN